MNEKQYKKLSIKEFDAAAEKFDGDDLSIYNMCRKDYPDILEELEKEPFQDMLDAGCGTGAVIALLKQKYPKKNYTGIDLSGKMIEVAKKKKLDKVVFVQGDCENLPFDKASFDVITCSMSFHHYPNPDQFFTSCNRILKSGGRLVLRDGTASEIPLWLMNHIQIPCANKLFHKGDVHLYNKKELVLLCKNANMKLELFEQRPAMRLHAVCRKK
ncbi:MAG: class I SAM-dependent methyltransferase [Velocimicrobium sp.]